MFAIHGNMELLKRDRQPIGTYARHNYDLFQPAGQEEVVAMLKSAEYAANKADYDQISRNFLRSSRQPNSPRPSKGNMMGSARCFVTASTRRGTRFRFVYWIWICDLSYSNGC